MAKRKDKDLHSQIVKHLKGDVKMYGSEAAEDRALMKKVLKKGKKQSMKDRYREHSGEERAEHGYHKTSNPKRSFKRFVEEKEMAKHKPVGAYKKRKLEKAKRKNK